MSLVSSINSRGIFSFQKGVEKSEKSVEILTPTFHPSRLFRYRTTKYFSPSFYFPPLSSLPFFLFFFSFHFVSKRCPSNDQCIAVNAAASSVVNVSRRARFFKSMIPSPPPPRAYTMGGQDFFQCQGKRIRAMYPRKEAISLPLPVFGSISALRARNIIPSAISLLGSIHM